MLSNTNSQAKLEPVNEQDPGYKKAVKAFHGLPPSSHAQQTYLPQKSAHSKSVS